MSFWISKNSYVFPPDTVVVPDRDTTDRSTVVQYTYRSSENTPGLTLLKVIGGGHTWPGAPPSATLGVTNYDINANHELWEFFKQSSLTTDVGTDPGTPAGFVLSPNYPNPFNPSTTIRYTLPASSEVRLSVFDTLGREVSVLVNGRRDAGDHDVKFDASGLASGVYYYRLQSGPFIATRKLLFVK